MIVKLMKASVWLPENVETAAQIAAEANLPEVVVREKMGIVQKCRATKDEHPSMMAIEAARSVLKNEAENSIDLIIWTGSEYKDFPVWSAGIFVQRELGLTRAHAFDMAARCSTNVVALKMAKSLMLTDKKIKRVLLCGGHKTGDLVNYQDPKSRFLYNLSDGGSAMLLERFDSAEEIHAAKDLGAQVLETSIITDGAFSLDVIIPAGGTRMPAHENISKADACLQVPDIEGMRERLAEKSIERFMKVIKTAATESMNRPIDYLALLHMKKSAHDEICQQLELKEEQSIYLDHYGHFGAPDQVLSLGLAEHHQRLKTGDHVVLASAGIGYTWSAISLRWDGPVFDQSTLKYV